MSIPKPSQHGGDATAVAAALDLDPSTFLDLSASLNPFAPSVANVAQSHLDALTPYPDDADATKAMAKALDVDPLRLVLTNGGSEAIALVASLLGRGNIVEPEFSLYRRHLSAIDESAGRWRSNPSNPLGQLASHDDVAEVWDEAFYPIATGTWTRGDDDAWRLGSLTKLWACAGLRLGYVIAPDQEAAEEISERRPRWSVNGLALAVLPELLALTDLPTWSQQIADLRASFASELGALGLRVDESSANWVLVHDVPGLREALAPDGVLVRDCENFGLHGTVRIALPAPEDVPFVVTAVEKALDASIN